jgi:hypothetical protein
MSRREIVDDIQRVAGAVHHASTPAREIAATGHRSVVALAVVAGATLFAIVVAIGVIVAVAT